MLPLAVLIWRRLFNPTLTLARGAVAKPFPLGEKPVNNLRGQKLWPKKKRVLILCTGNSARSQMAEGLLRRLSKQGGGAFEVFSAGTRASFVRPEAIQTMSEIGIDISNHRSKSVEEFIDQQFDYVITVWDNAKESCPVFPGNAVRIHQSFDDPPPPGVGDDEFRLAVFRRVRDEIRQ